MILSFGLDKNLRGRVANRAGLETGFQVACGGLVLILSSLYSSSS